MRVLYGQPLTEAEKQEFTPVVHSNTIVSMKALCHQSKIMENDKEILEENRDSVIIMRNASETATIDKELGTAIKKLWKVKTFIFW